MKQTDSGITQLYCCLLNKLVCVYNVNALHLVMIFFIFLAKSGYRLNKYIALCHPYIHKKI